MVCGLKSNCVSGASSLYVGAYFRTPHVSAISEPGCWSIQEQSKEKKIQMLGRIGCSAHAKKFWGVLTSGCISRVVGRCGREGGVVWGDGGDSQNIRARHIYDRRLHFPAFLGRVSHPNTVKHAVLSAVTCACHATSQHGEKIIRSISSIRMRDFWWPNSASISTI